MILISSDQWKTSLINLFEVQMLHSSIKFNYGLLLISNLSSWKFQVAHKIIEVFLFDIIVRLIYQLSIRLQSAFRILVNFLMKKWHSLNKLQYVQLISQFIYFLFFSYIWLFLFGIIRLSEFWAFQSLILKYCWTIKFHEVFLNGLGYKVVSNFSLKNFK